MLTTTHSGLQHRGTRCCSSLLAGGCCAPSPHTRLAVSCAAAAAVRTGDGLDCSSLSPRPAGAARSTSLTTSSLLTSSPRLSRRRTRPPASR